MDVDVNGRPAGDPDGPGVEAQILALMWAGPRIPEDRLRARMAPDADRVADREQARLEKLWHADALDVRLRD